MSTQTCTALVRRGLTALDFDDVAAARVLFEEAVRQAPTPVVLSCLGFCQARLETDLEAAFALCREALRLEPANPLHHLNLGRVHLAASDKRRAVAAFRTGLQFGCLPRLVDEIERLGVRRPLFFPALGRSHPLNVSCGLVFSRLGVRGFLHQPEKYRRHYR